LVEIEELAKTRFGAYAAALVDRMSLGGQRIDIQTLTWGQFWTLLRALDHVRNASLAGRKVQRLRSALVASGITYRLQAPGGDRGTFFSYSNTYEEGDRLVPAPETVFRVVRIESPEDEPTLLVCRPWD
jgi:hypothetical protein